MSADLPQSSRVSRRLRWLLIGSLALNVLVLGSVVGMGLRHFGEEPRRSQAERSFGLGPWGPAFTRDDHKKLRKLFEEKNYDFRGDVRAEREDRARLLTALRADPFDAMALQQIMDGMQARSGQRMALGNQVLVSYLAGLTSEERRAAAERMEADERARAEARRERRGAKD